MFLVGHIGRFAYQCGNEIKDVYKLKRVDRHTTGIAFANDQLTANCDEFSDESQVGIATSHAIFKLVMDRPVTVFPIDHFHRLGFSEDDSDDKVQQQRVCQRELLRVFFIDMSDTRYSKVGHFASDELRGGPETFSRIPFHTLTMNKPDPTLISGKEEKEVEKVNTVMSSAVIKPKCILKITPSACARWLNELDNYFHDHPNEYFWITGPGKRPPGNVHRMKLTISIFHHSKGGRCIRAEIANAMNDIGDEEKANNVLKRGMTYGKLLGVATTDFDKIVTGLELKKRWR